MYDFQKESNFSNNLYVYFFIDVKDSRNNINDLESNRNLLTLLQLKLNKKFKSRLVTRFSIKDGDALIGGMHSFSSIIEVYQECLEFYYSEDFLKFKKNNNILDNIEFYFGTGLGTIDTDKSVNNNLEEINGSSFINAKNASDKAKEITKLEEKKVDTSEINSYYFNLSPFKFYCISPKKYDFSSTVNSMFYLCYEKLISTEKQLHLFTLKESEIDYKNYRLAELLGYKTLKKNIASSRISTLIKNSQYHVFKNTKQNIINTLDTIESIIKISEKEVN